MFVCVCVDVCMSEWMCAKCGESESEQVVSPVLVFSSLMLVDTNRIRDSFYQTPCSDTACPTVRERTACGLGVGGP